MSGFALCQPSNLHHQVLSPQSTSSKASRVELINIASDCHGGCRIRLIGVGDLGAGVGVHLWGKSCQPRLLLPPVIGNQPTLRLPPVNVMLTNRRVYTSLFLARPLLSACQKSVLLAIPRSISRSGESTGRFGVGWVDIRSLLLLLLLDLGGLRLDLACVYRSEPVPTYRLTPLSHRGSLLRSLAWRRHTGTGQTVGGKVSDLLGCIKIAKSDLEISLPSVNLSHFG